ncbi:MAG: MBOAT family protein [Proteobacteria bacterium]|nr:MBOAT family protein [Pseudomonadota bacterium]
MLFTSYVFLFAFLPLALAGFHAAARMGGRPAAGLCLVLGSLVFYGWWNPASVPLLAVSVLANFAAGRVLAATVDRPAVQGWVFGLAVAANLGALVWFKYLGWLLGLIGAPAWLAAPAQAAVLPLGISFFTFTQILYLADCRQAMAGGGREGGRGLLDYGLFVTFFPHLIAGPILHHRDVMPQFADAATYRFRAENLVAGLGIFVVGMMKKCLIADPIGAGVAASFAAPQGLPLGAAWQAALSYSMQLYFDFSGYSDMAIGLGLMFNLRLPLNFNSPYKSSGIIEYWQRWHMTLTRTITLLIYNPIALAVARARAARGLKGRPATLGGFAAAVALPTGITMALAGIWHGAGAQFLAFGLLHAAYLTANHAWRTLRRAAAPLAGWRGRIAAAGSVLLTYLAVLVASVFFRAPSVSDALAMLGGMAGLHGVAALPEAAGGDPMAGRWQGWEREALTAAWLAGLYLLVWLAPNTQQIFAAARPALDRAVAATGLRLRWRMSYGWAVAAGLGGVAAVLAMGGSGEFLYFQF